MISWPIHLALIAGIALLSFVLVALTRRGVLNGRVVCFTIAIFLVTAELGSLIWIWSNQGFHTWNLPLQLCDAILWAAALACLTRSAVFAEFTWFAGLAGAGMALLTPNLIAPWPSWPDTYFFLAHGGVVAAAMMLAYSGVIDFHPRSIWRPFALLLAWAAFCGVVDELLHADYMFLCDKPDAASLLNLLGPWPWYIASAAGVALVLFWLLWLPVRPRGRVG